MALLNIKTLAIWFNDYAKMTINAGNKQLTYIVVNIKHILQF